MADPKGEAEAGADAPFVERAAEWAAGLAYDDVPREVRRAAVAQLASTVGAAAWTCSHPVGGKIARTVDGEFGVDGGTPTAGDGSATFLPLGAVRPRAACYGHAALSMALDFDDTILGGHTGHSAALVPLAYAEARGASGRRALTAFVAANEVAARLAAAAAIGPFRGQQTAYVHAVGAAIARGVVENADADALANAVAIALGQPPWPLAAGFLGSDAKVFSAADPVLAGLSAVESTRQGLRGNPELVEDDEGFLSAFADYPLPEFLAGLGERWHTRAVTVKPSPGCAYVTAPVHAALAIRERLVQRAGDERAPSGERPGEVDIASVEVAGSLFTTRANDLAERYVAGPDSRLAALNFSVPYNVAVALVDGEHTPRQFLPERLDDERVWTLADRVTVEHDPDLTLRALQSEVPVGAMLRRMGWRVLPYAAKTVGPARALRNLPTLLRFARKRPLPESFAGADKTIGAHVRVALADGTTLTASCPHPPGFAGHPLPEIERVACQKLRDGLAAAGGVSDEYDAPDGVSDEALDAGVETVTALAEQDPVDLSRVGALVEP